MKMATAKNTAAILSVLLRRIRTAVRPDVRVTAAPDDIQVDWDVPVTVRDGVVLRVNVFRPRTSAPVPVLMSAHPYGKDRIPAKTRSRRGLPIQTRFLLQPHGVEISEWTSWETPDPVVWVRQGYAVINADLRGAGTSEGVCELFSDVEARDLYDLIEWAGTRDWSSGRVGLDGVSYLAISQYKVAALRPPHLAAICPWEGFSDLYRDFARPGGVRETGFSKLWSRLTSRVARVKTPIFEEIVARPLRDRWYEQLTPDLARIEVPMLVCGSFSDQSLHTRGSFEVFRRAGSSRKWLYTHRDGKWCAYYSEDATRTRLRFFDHVLKDLDNGWAGEPRVRLAITDAGPDPVAVVAEAEWPPSDLTWRTLSFDASKRMLVDENTPVAPSSSSFECRSGAVRFEWIAPRDMDVIGSMALHLAIELEGVDDVLLFAAVRKMRAGMEVTFEGSYGFPRDMVSKGWLRAAHREIDTELSTPEQPVHTHRHVEPLAAGEIVPVQIALLPHATRFRKGDALVVEVRGRWHYATDRLRGAPPASYEASVGGRCIIHTGGRNASFLLLGCRAPTSTSTEYGGAENGSSRFPSGGRGAHTSGRARDASATTLV